MRWARFRIRMAHGPSDWEITEIPDALDLTNKQDVDEWLTAYHLIDPSLDHYRGFDIEQIDLLPPEYIAKRLKELQRTLEYTQECLQTYHNLCAKQEGRL